MSWRSVEGPLLTLLFCRYLQRTLPGQHRTEDVMVWVRHSVRPECNVTNRSAGLRKACFRVLQK